MEGHEGSHTSKISLKGKRKTWGKRLFLEIFLSDQGEPIEGNQLALVEFLSPNKSSVDPILREFLSG